MPHTSKGSLPKNLSCLEETVSGVKMNSIAEGVECEAQPVPRTQSDSGGTHPTGWKLG